uniref:Uncharacterized protein n=1 Tax=Marseillevirus LCMAC101 TaxID=2506602 RepID=A0A481YQW7_9VIRU|nr:MAG: uncharacterized protein LCMAC101_02480 [Marseillevirus LCMAC101]
MNILLLANGERDMSFRPYINLEEFGSSISLYDPNGPSFRYGLYDMAGQPSCGPWINIYDQYPSRIPAAVITPTGRQHMVQPWWKKGYHYDPLLRHTRNTGSRN